MDDPTFISHLEKAVAARRSLFDVSHRSAFRLFNGFNEGNPNLVIDLYASTLVFHDYTASGSTMVFAKHPGGADRVEQSDRRSPATDTMESFGQITAATKPIHEAMNVLRNQFPWLGAGILKTRNGKTQQEKRGQLLFGEKPDRKIREHGVWYAIDLTMNRDTSLYLDTRNLRQWLIENMGGKTVLNTFAYTGSLGVAAIAGGASRVVQVDLNRQFLNLAKDSYTLNGFPIHKSDFVASDFFPAIGRFKRKGETFDCVLIDPPFFSTTSKGKVDQQNESGRLINKVRPLINDGGTLIAINNALYVSGKEYMQMLERLCEDGYLMIRELIPVPADMIGYSNVGAPITDPRPFNHSTKIAILDVKRK